MEIRLKVTNSRHDASVLADASDRSNLPAALASPRQTAVRQVTSSCPREPTKISDESQRHSIMSLGCNPLRVAPHTFYASRKIPVWEEDI